MLGRVNRIVYRMQELMEIFLEALYHPLTADPRERDRPQQSVRRRLYSDWWGGDADDAYQRRCIRLAARVLLVEMLILSAAVILGTISHMLK